jgi:hypothetical protein
LQNDGISRSQLAPCLSAFGPDVGEMTHRKVPLLEKRVKFQWICGKEYPTSMLCLLTVSSEANDVDWNGG